MTTTRRVLLVVAAMIGVLIVCFVAVGIMIDIMTPPSQLTVRNSLRLPVTDVVVEGIGFKERFAKLLPGESVVRRFDPGPDSGVGVSFWLEGRRVAVAPQDYVTGGGYLCLIDISSESSASVRCRPAA